MEAVGYLFAFLLVFSLIMTAVSTGKTETIVVYLFHTMIRIKKLNPKEAIERTS